MCSNAASIVGRILIGFVFIDALVDEDAFQRSEHHALEQFAAANLQLAAQEVGSVRHIRAQHLAHRHKRGVSVSMIQQLGEMLTSQSVNA